MHHKKRSDFCTFREFAVSRKRGGSPRASLVVPETPHALLGMSRSLRGTRKAGVRLSMKCAARPPQGSAFGGSASGQACGLATQFESLRCTTKKGVTFAPSGNLRFPASGVASCLVGRPRAASRFARHVSVSPRHTKGGCPPFYEMCRSSSARLRLRRKRERASLRLATQFESL